MVPRLPEGYSVRKRQRCIVQMQPKTTTCWSASNKQPKLTNICLGGRRSSNTLRTGLVRVKIARGSHDGGAKQLWLELHGTRMQLMQRRRQPRQAFPHFHSRALDMYRALCMKPKVFDRVWLIVLLVAMPVTFLTDVIMTPHRLSTIPPYHSFPFGASPLANCGFRSMERSALGGHIASDCDWVLHWDVLSGGHWWDNNARACCCQIWRCRETVEHA